MKTIILLTIAATISGLSAQGTGWTSPAGRTQVPIWPGTIPDAKTTDGPEKDMTKPSDNLIAGKPVMRFGNVAMPTMTVYPAQGRNTEAAVLVFPGGGYQILAIDLEGTEVCDWLSGAGVTCVLVKYRVPNSGPFPKSPMALEDAQRAMGIVRSRAAEWQIDPHKIGVLGFSAGAHLAAALSTHYAQRLYPPVDADDQTSCRPDFAVIVYPGYLALADKNFALNPDIPVTAQTPPTFLLQTEDDRVAHVESSIAYYQALAHAGVPVEMHLYSEGVHGYGLRRTALPVTTWPQLVETWLHTIKLVQ